MRIIYRAGTGSGRKQCAQRGVALLGRFIDRIDVYFSFSFYVWIFILLISRLSSSHFDLESFNFHFYLVSPTMGGRPTQPNSTLTFRISLHHAGWSATWSVTVLSCSLRCFGAQWSFIACHDWSISWVEVLKASDFHSWLTHFVNKIAQKVRFFFLGE